MAAGRQGGARHPALAPPFPPKLTGVMRPRGAPSLQEQEGTLQGTGGRLGAPPKGGTGLALSRASRFGFLQQK